MSSPDQTSYPPLVPPDPRPRPPLSVPIVTGMVLLALLVPVMGAVAALAVGVINHGRRGAMGLIIFGACMALASIALWVLVFTTGVTTYYIPSAAMEPSLKPRQTIAATKVQVRSGVLPQRGEIWAFKFPDDPKVLYIKRVVGLPGETVEIAGGRLLINGAESVVPEWAEPPTMDFPPTAMAADMYFVMGDNTNRSSDSRVWGPVPADHFVARYWFTF